MKSEVRIGVIGCGGMGRNHMKTLQDVPRARLVAVADSFPDSLKAATDQFDVKAFDDGHKLIASGEVDAILIATPHYFHPPYAIAGLEAGLHVMTEKPVSVTASEAEQVNAVAAAHPELRYGAMFQMRTSGMWRKVKQMVDSGQVGAIQRVHWTITSWFRSQAYYDSGGWRATWAGEGGGVLLNQCPHNLDLLTWITGQPARVMCMLSLGKYHKIEVEDEVTAYMEYANGATGVFITSTGEAPGTNFFEIVGDQGRITVPGNAGAALEYVELSQSASEYCRTSSNRFGGPEATVSQVHTPGGGGSHKLIHENFVNAILDDEPLVAPAAEGLLSVELANAMIQSGVKREWVDLPMDRPGYQALLESLKAGGSGKV